MTSNIKTAGIGLAVLAACAGAIAVAYAAWKEAPPPPAVAIEAYIAPPLLFPEDGTYPQGVARQYRPFPVHASPDGKLVGHVHTNYVKCGADCPSPGAATLVKQDGSRHILKTEAWGYATSGLYTYEVPTVSGKMAWSRILYDGGHFWIKTPKKDVHPYEPMVTHITQFDTICTKPGHCKPVSPAIRKQLDELVLSTCYGDPYGVQKIVTVEGQRYYQVVLEDVEPQKTPVTLPRKAFIPTRNKDGKHTGSFDPMGC
jgi:hypothetical protein